MHYFKLNGLTETIDISNTFKNMVGSFGWIISFATSYLVYSIDQV
jgi:hypothetical protein